MQLNKFADHDGLLAQRGDDLDREAGAHPGHEGDQPGRKSFLPASCSAPGEGQS